MADLDPRFAPLSADSSKKLLVMQMHHKIASMENAKLSSLIRLEEIDQERQRIEVSVKTSDAQIAETKQKLEEILKNENLK